MILLKDEIAKSYILYIHFDAHDADLDCVSSYQVNVYPDREECGGIAEREQPGIQFININRVSRLSIKIIIGSSFTAVYDYS